MANNISWVGEVFHLWKYKIDFGSVVEKCRQGCFI